MQVNKSTRYALYAAMDMARAGPEEAVTASHVAERYRLPQAVVAKVLQQLMRAGLALGTRGAGGGYRLAKPPSELTVLDVIEVFEPLRAPGACLLASEDEEPCEATARCRLRHLFDEVDEQARSTFASVTLETLVGRRAAESPPLVVLGRG